MSKLQLIVLGEDGKTDPEVEDRGIYVSWSPGGTATLTTKPGYEGKDCFTCTARAPRDGDVPMTVALIHTDY